MAQRTWQFRIDPAQAGDVLILTLAGRLGQASVNLLHEALAHIEAPGVLIDLAGLDYISGPGLAAMRDAASAAEGAGQPFVVCGLEGSVRVAFDLAGLFQALRVEEDRAGGLARIAALRDA